jgi:spermidine/putrescine transport system permease protein
MDSTSVAAPRTPRRRFRAPKFTLALPTWAFYVVFFAVPVAFIIVYSFGTKVQGSAGRTDLSPLTLERYRDAFDPTFFTVMRQTMRISITGTLLCLVIGFPVAYFMAVRVPPRWRGVLLGVLIIPFWTNFLIRTIAWKIVLSPVGFFSNWFQDIGLRDSNLQVLNTKAAVQLGVVYNYLPLMIFPLFVTLDRLEPVLREASKDLGAGRIKTFLQVTLPLSAPGVVAGLLLVFIPLSGDYITAAVLGGADGNMAGALVASQFLQAQNQALGSAIAVILMGAIILSISVVAVAALLVRTVIRRARRVDLAEFEPTMAGV